MWGRKQELPAPLSCHVPLNRYTVYNAEGNQSCKVSCMADPVVTPLINVCVALTSMLLNAAQQSQAAAIASEARDPISFLAQSLLGRRGTQKDIERRISKDLTSRMQDMNERCSREGIDPDRLANPCAEVEDILRAIDDHKRFLEQAVHDPDAVRAFFEQQAQNSRIQVDERLVPYFDELLKAVTELYITYAERSSNYQQLALKQLLKSDREKRETLARLHDTVADVPHKVAELVSSESKPSCVFFGSRPEVVTGDRYIERDEHEHLNALIADPTQRRTVLVGMRGCGKTQLASTLAQQCEDAHWSLVAWVNASSTESITSDLVELAKELKKELKIETSDQPTPKTIIRRLFNRLKSADPSDRLIVFDNVEDINHLTGLIPSGDGLRVVATTTNKVGWEDQGWNSIKVEVFDRDESIKYLLTATESTDRDAADTLAHRLGDLPLALAQAAATARNGNLSLARYLDRLDRYRSERVIRPVPGDYYTVDVATALCMTIEDALENLEGGTKQAARYILGALALLAESGVPTRWLDPMSEEHDEQELQDHDRAEDEDAHDALTELIHRSIVQQSSDKATTTLHRLQAEVLRDNWDDKETAEAYESATILLDTVNVDSFLRNNTDSIHLIEQFATISTQHHSQQLFGDNKVRSCLLQALLFADTLDLPVEPHGLTNIVVVLENILGSDHVDVVTARNCLAGAYRSAGHFSESINLYERVLTDRIRILGESNRSTLATRSDLASAHALAGHLPEAISQYKQVLNEQTRILGTEDVNTLTTQYNLASAYFISQQYNLAIPLYEQVLSKQTSSLGPNHPHTLVTQSSLAFAHFSTGNLSEAISLYKYKQVLPNQIERLGPSHRYTLTTRENIATVYRLEGDLNKAIDQYETILKDCTDALGTKHPLTVDVHKKLEAARRELAEQEDSSHIEERGTQGRGAPTPAGH